jgi:hypothetical protein
MYVGVRVKYRYSCQSFLDIFSNNTQMSNFIKIRPVGAEFHYRHDEANSRFLKFYERA